MDHGYRKSFQEIWKDFRKLRRAQGITTHFLAHVMRSGKTTDPNCVFTFSIFVTAKLRLTFPFQSCCG